jgi:hypothetical protein
MTEELAVRLMKCQARHYVYAERAGATGNPALRNMLVLEDELLRNAEADWREIMPLWRGCTVYERQALVAILIKAMSRARRDACAIFDDRITGEALLRYFDTFSPEDLIPSEDAS